MPSRQTQDQFIEKARQKHGSLYDYSLVDYKHSHKKVSIVCDLHGSFLQKPAAHLSGYGCPKCRYIKSAKKMALTLEQFVEKSRQVHGDLYDYSSTKYINANQKVAIGCPKHGTFHQLARSHLSGFGCTLCGLEKITDSHEDFLRKAGEVHAEKYDYSLTRYAGWDSKVEIVCREHGSFMQSPSSHLQGQGCPHCAKTGFKIDKPAFLYFVKFQKPYASFWKIGITNKTIRSRFNADTKYIVEQHSWRFLVGLQAYQLEQKVLLKFKAHKFDSKNFLFPLNPHRGDTECFNHDLPSRKVIAFIGSEVEIAELQALNARMES